MSQRYDPDKHHRRSIRLREWDCRNAGAYFVTICTCGGEYLFGEVADADMRLNIYGEIVTACWNAIPRHFANAELDAFVVMPNHMHGIVVLRRGKAFGSEASALLRDARPNALPLHRLRGTPPGSLAAIVQNFKAVASRRINRARGTPGAPVWQRNYWEHIIRDDRALGAIRQYIADNPARWSLDVHNRASEGEDPQAQALWDMLRR